MRTPCVKMWLAQDAVCTRIGREVGSGGDLKPYTELTRRGRVRRLRSVALKALAHYDLEISRLEFGGLYTNNLPCSYSARAIVCCQIMCARLADRHGYPFRDALVAGFGRSRGYRCPCSVTEP